MIGHVIVNGKMVERPLRECRGLLVRDGTADQRTLGEIVRSYGWLDIKDRVVLDIGAHIGGFSRWALEHGAFFVNAVEPDQCNFEMLARNLKNYLPFQANIINTACVPDEFHGDAVWLYHTVRGHSHGMVSTVPMKGRTQTRLAAVTQFNKLLSLDSGAMVVKVDCEGAEYGFLNGQTLPNHVKEVAVEIHLTKREWRDKNGPELVASFAEWECVVEPTIGLKNWATIGGWRRRNTA